MALPQTASALCPSRTGKGGPLKHRHILVSLGKLETLASPSEPSTWNGTESKAYRSCAEELAVIVRLQTMTT